MRIASLLPAATEIVVALGLADQLVAVTFECSAARAQCPVVVDTAIPPDLTPAQVDGWVRDRAARGLPLYALDRAALAAAAPDLVLTQDLCRVCALPAATVAEACRVIGIDADVLSVDPHSVDDVLDTGGTFLPRTSSSWRRAVKVSTSRWRNALPSPRGWPARRSWRSTPRLTFVQAGPALVDGVEALAWALHPDAVAPPPAGRIAAYPSTDADVRQSSR